MIRFEDIVDAVLAYNESADIDLIKKAYVYSAKVHSGQLRDSGEPYLSHPLAVAHLLTKLNMDETSIAAGLLHDTIEDTCSTPEEIKDLFGEEVLFLVDGLTKIGRIKFSSQEEQQAENYRKMILALSKDIRVIIIKLVDRLHNMRTIDILPPPRKKRIAQETLNLYVPIAERLGISWIKHELEEIAAQTIYKREYLKVKDKLSLTKEEREAYINKVIAIVEEKLKGFGKPVKIEGRPKSFYSIHNKMLSQNISLDELYDLNGIRIICDTEGDCYSLLGI
ncbi:MAG: HD domain-containing protein, partial [Nitrospinota bacterium]